MKSQLLKRLFNLVPRTQPKQNLHHHHHEQQHHHHEQHHHHHHEQQHHHKPKREESQEEEKPVLRRERTFEIDPKMSIRQVRRNPVDKI